MSSHINYRELFFQHPVLTKIAGDPTYTSLAKLERECKANAKSVRSSLGGGQQGHLGLISSAPAYARIAPGTPFHRPGLPAPAVTVGTAAVIAASRLAYDEQLRAFDKCTQIERAITQQINTALDADVLSDLIDDATGLLVGTVPDIMRGLYETYGTVTPQALNTAKEKLGTIAYDHSRPIANLFTSINDYAHMAEASGATETPEQLINIGLIIVTRATIFATDIRVWNAKPAATKTWLEFKTHFREAQKAIKRSQPPTTTDTLGYHGEANSATEGDNDNSRIGLPSNDDNELTVAETAAAVLANQQLEIHLANIASSAQSAHQNQTMMAQMQTMMSTISELQSKVHQNSGNNGNRNDGGRNNGNRNDGRRGRGRGHQGGNNQHGGNQQGGSQQGGRPQQPRKYCWTHGLCAHDSPSCTAQKIGHQTTATMQNMQNGSTQQCFWL
jgi:hypothetical protein